MDPDTRCESKVVVLEVLGTRVQQNPAHQSTKTSRNANKLTFLLACKTAAPQLGEN
jgi:hypothetical protein